MTQFENLELLYAQFFNLADEIKSMIENEEYTKAFERLNYKEKLIKKLLTTKKTVNLSEEDKNKLSLIEEQLKERERDNISMLKKIQDEVGANLKSTKNKVKVNSAYTIQHNNNRGVFFDISE